MDKRTFPISSVYLTRRCPRACEYCRIRDPASLSGPELSILQWKRAFKILKEIGVEFNVVLGNEVLMLREGLVELTGYLNKENILYAYYTTFPEPLWSTYRDDLVAAKVYNFSSGIDTLPKYSPPNSDIAKKSEAGLLNLGWCKAHGIPDTHATVTVSRLNLPYLPSLVQDISDKGIWIALNPIHHNKHDDKFDFFPPPEEIQDLLLTEKDLLNMIRIAKQLQAGVIQGKYRIQNTPEFFFDWIKHGIKQDWHCSPDTMIFCVDSDGMMRTCSYRRDTLSAKYSIFDLPEKLDEFLEENRKDRANCSGCLWYCWWQLDNLQKTGSTMAKDKFRTHKSEYFKEEK